MYPKLTVKFLLCLVLSGIFGVSACKTGRKVADSSPLNKKQVMNAENLLNQKIDFSTFSAKSSIAVRTSKGHQQLSANIRMHKDQDIWASVIALGIAEVARALITPDSLRAINRINKKAYELSYEQGLQLIKAELEFPALQNLLIGNPLLDHATILSVKEAEDAFIILQEKQGLTQELTYETATKNLIKQELRAPEKQFRCVIDYAGYQPAEGNRRFAANRRLHIENRGDTVSVEMGYSKLSFDQPVKTEFEVPDSYRKAAP